MSLLPPFSASRAPIPSLRTPFSVFRPLFREPAPWPKRSPGIRYVLKPARQSPLPESDRKPAFRLSHGRFLPGRSLASGLLKQLKLKAPRELVLRKSLTPWCESGSETDKSEGYRNFSSLDRNAPCCPDTAEFSVICRPSTLTPSLPEISAWRHLKQNSQNLPVIAKNPPCLSKRAPQASRMIPRLSNKAPRIPNIFPCKPSIAGGPARKSRFLSKTVKVFSKNSDKSLEGSWRTRGPGPRPYAAF
jgi:hypothetical protein